ncbi:hypothetical protein AB0J74_03730 [Asanoa sp. NPDC049573]|uniref:hypothetical protein n=1 Tax=Asanoa sp. NPDC049573 TaxID=3155396 RepID=UPI00341C3B1F
MKHPGRAVLWVVGGHVALVLLGWAGTYLLPDQNTDGQCTGLGFGCALTPRDTARFAIMFIGIPALTVTALISLVVIAVWPKKNAPGAIRGRSRN